MTLKDNIKAALFGIVFCAIIYIMFRISYDIAVILLFLCFVSVLVIVLVYGRRTKIQRKRFWEESEITRIGPNASLHDLYNEVLRFTFRFIKLHGIEKKTLEIGFGKGILSSKLYGEGSKVFGIDPSENMVEVAKIKMPKGIFIFDNLLSSLPKRIMDEKYDYIISPYLINDLPYERKEELLKQLKGLLSPSGKIILGCLNDSLAEEKTSEKGLYEISELMSNIGLHYTYNGITSISGIFIMFLEPEIGVS